MATKAELERENVDLVAALQHARSVLDSALGIEDDDDESDEDEDDDE